MTRLFQFDQTKQRDPEVERWFAEHSDELGATAKHWFEIMRRCGDDVREILHDGQPTACVDNAAFAYVDTCKAHVNVGFFLGALLPDPKRLLQGSGRFMRHAKVRTDGAIDEKGLTKLIETSYLDMKKRLEAG